MLAKSSGKMIKDVMTPKPKTVSPDTCLEDATRYIASIVSCWVPAGTA